VDGLCLGVMSNEVDSLSAQLAAANAREAALWEVVDALQNALKRADQVVNATQRDFILSPAALGALRLKSGGELPVARTNRVFKNKEGRTIGVEVTSPCLSYPRCFGDCSDENAASVEIV